MCSRRRLLSCRCGIPWAHLPREASTPGQVSRRNIEGMEVIVESRVKAMARGKRP